jgi:hypothetical protein
MMTNFLREQFWGISVLITLTVSLSAAEASSAHVRPLTFARDVAPILQERCQECHREGSMAPMSFVTYDETRPWAKAIREQVIKRQMPPWHIDRTIGVQQFKNDISLTDDQINTIVRWVDSGAPLGDVKDMAPARQWGAENEWKAAKELGQPDLVIKSDPYTMAAHGQDVFWRPTSDVPLTEPRWVRAVEMRPGTLAGRRMTHHAVAILVQDEPGADPALGGRGLLMEWAIGKGYDLFRPNSGRLLLPGSQISWEVHIHAVGEEIRDNVELGIWFYPKGREPKYRTHLTAFHADLPAQPATGVTNTARRLDIPPNSMVESHYDTVLQHATIIENFQPHMHLRGKAMAVEAILPDGSKQMVSYIGNFKFNWMTNYIYADDAAPVFPKGTIIRVTARFDNTRNHVGNPDPDQWVGFGERTVDEMCHACMNVTYISDEEYDAWAAEHKQKARQTAGSLLPATPVETR